jgi:hypothetical protein
MTFKSLAKKRHAKIFAHCGDRIKNPDSLMGFGARLSGII